MATCPNCGGDHESEGWEPLPEIDRDITAITAALLTPGTTIADFANLLGDGDRAPALLLRACQVIATYSVALLAIQGVDEPQEKALVAMRTALLHYAEDEANEEENTE